MINVVNVHIVKKKINVYFKFQLQNIKWFKVVTPDLTTQKKLNNFGVGGKNFFEVTRQTGIQIWREKQTQRSTAKVSLPGA